MDDSICNKENRPQAEALRLILFVLYPCEGTEVAIPQSSQTVERLRMSRSKEYIMENGRVYYHVVFSVTRGKPVFLDEAIDTNFKQMVREIMRQKGWLLLELETMPNHVHLLLEKAPWDDLSKVVGYLKGRTARALLTQFPWLRGDLDSYYFWNRSFHYTRHTDESLDTVRGYIRNQRKAGGLSE